MPNTSRKRVRARNKTCRKVISVMCDLRDIRGRDISVGTVTIICDGQQGLGVLPPPPQEE
jgi:hypothetical protein